MAEIVPRATGEPPRWRPLPARERRLLGVLIEKAKTTPDAYPLSANALRSGANQKNNRYPLMELELEDVEESLQRLRATGAVTEVQGGGRVARFRHHAYEWLGVEKVELAVMAELLLRGAQTEGELRGRAARMEPIADVAALRPVLVSLKTKGLIVSLTPEGRGHMLTHALYEPRELEKVRAEAQAAGGRELADEASATSHAATSHAATSHAETSHAEPHPTAMHAAREAVPAAHGHFAPRVGDETIEELRHKLDHVIEQMAALRREVDELAASLR